MSKKKPGFLDRFFKSRQVKGGKPAIRREIIGFVFLAIGVVWFLSILSYHPADPSLRDPRIDGNEFQYVRNVVGILGATIANEVFQWTFGYAALVFPILLIMASLSVILGERLNKLIPITFVMLGWAYLASIIMAIPNSYELLGFSNNYYPSGLLGGVTADSIVQYLGRFTLVFLTGIYAIILMMITFRFRISTLPVLITRLVSRVTDRIAAWVQNTVHYVRGIPWLAERKQRAQTRSTMSSASTASTQRTISQPPVEEQESRVHSFSDLESPSETISAEIEKDPFKVNEPESFEGLGEPTPSTRIAYPAAPLDQQLNEMGLDSKDADGAEQIEADFEKVPSAGRIIEEVVEEAKVDYDALVRDAMRDYQLPPLETLNEDSSESKISREELMANADLLENTLAQFGVKAFVKKVIEGPVITLYAVRPAEGVKINQVVSLSDDLALAMRAKGIRMIAPIPGEAAIGIEIPNRRPSTVFFKSIVQSEKFANNPGQLVLGMGKTIGGEVFCADLTRMPHLLIAGSTGAGKSVGINTMLASILYRVPPSKVKFVLIDPKKLELSLYAKIREQYLAYCPDLDEVVVTHPQNAILILKAVVNEMEERYDTLASLGVRDIIAYNKKVEKLDESGQKPQDMVRLPYIIVVIDELADLILTASREVEEPITRLAQMARAVGIHLIVATQRPSVDILTGLIKANFPTRIAYQVATRPDSKTILDMYGAEKLIGNGDFLFLPPGTGKPVRLQNPFISTEEVESMISHIKKQPKFPPYELKLVRNKEVTMPEAAKRLQQDELFDKAREVVVRHQQGSVSLLQRKLKIGYARAGRLMDELEEAGIVGPGQGSKARDVLVSSFSDRDS